MEKANKEKKQALLFTSLMFLQFMFSNNTEKNH